MIFIRYPFPCNGQIIDQGNIPVTAGMLRDTVETYLKYSDFSLVLNGRKLYGMEVIQDHSTVHVTFSLPGGKGGFGSMLRAIGAQIEKTTNREACRDLSGRRLRDINEEQRLKKWISKEAEREAEKIKRRQARIERLKTKAPHNFFDYEYEKEISQLPDRINDALSEGLQKAKDPKKRPLEKTEGTKLPKKSWMDDLPLTSSDSDSDDMQKKNADGESSPSKKRKTESNDYTSSSSEMTDSLEPQPCSSKQCTYEESYSNDTFSSFTQSKSEEDSSDSVKNDSQSKETVEKDDQSSLETHSVVIDKTKKDSVIETTAVTDKTEKCNILSENTSVQQPDMQDESPIDLMNFETVADLESLGLDRLKSALMSRGLKCGGTLSDRAQRLWKVRGLEPHEYPSNLLAKSKK